MHVTSWMPIPRDEQLHVERNYSHYISSSYISTQSCIKLTGKVCKSELKDVMLWLNVVHVIFHRSSCRLGYCCNDSYLATTNFGNCQFQIAISVQKHECFGQDPIKLMPNLAITANFEKKIGFRAWVAIKTMSTSSCMHKWEVAMFCFESELLYNNSNTV